MTRKLNIRNHVRMLVINYEDIQFNVGIESIECQAGFPVPSFIPSGTLKSDRVIAIDSLDQRPST